MIVLAGLLHLVRKQMSFFISRIGKFSQKSVEEKQHTKYEPAALQTLSFDGISHLCEGCKSVLNCLESFDFGHSSLRVLKKSQKDEYVKCLLFSPP